MDCYAGQSHGALPRNSRFAKLSPMPILSVHILITVCVLIATALSAFAQSTSFMPGSPVPSLWEKSAATVRGFVSPSDPTVEFIARAEKAVLAFWLDLINDPYQTSPGAQAFENAVDSVVYVITDNGTGIGLIIDERGLILTDWHVVKEAKTIAAVFRPKSIADIGKNLIVTANVFMANPGNDIAVLHLPHPPANRNPVAFGDVSKVHVSDQVFSIGLPTPEAWVYSDTTVTEINTTISWSEEYSKRVRHTQIHTQPMVIHAQTVSGSPGGPILNKRGDVIGVAAFYDPETSQSYAIPADTITSFLDVLPSPRAENIPDITSWAAETLTTWRRNGILKQFDTNDDGVIDRIGIDSDQNKYVDAWIIDEDQDGVPDYIARDADKNGRHEKTAHDKDGDGTYETHSFDHNNDSTPDVIGTDIDGDGIVDVLAVIQ